jgi:TonB-dependent receptor
MNRHYNKTLVSSFVHIAIKGSICAALTLPIAYYSHAVGNENQQANKEVKDNEVEQITVVGTRLQNQRAAEYKWESEKVVDVITADDIGSLPDFSVAEALTRITGVSVEARNGDAEFVVVRGLRSDFNYLSLDGGIIPSTRKGGRATQTSILPSYVIKSTEVVKSFTADMDGNAIGGQILINTRSAFDQDSTYFAARAALGKFEHDEGPLDTDQPVRSDFAFSQSFGDNDQFGVVLSTSYLNQDYYTDLPGANWDEYRFQEADGTLGRLYEEASVDAKRVPAGNQYYKYKNKIERLGGLAKFEWKPNDSFYTALTVYQFEENDTEDRWSGSLYHDFKSLDNVTDTSGHVAKGKGYQAYFLQGDDNKISSISLTGEWLIGDDSTLDFTIVKADGERASPFDEFRFFATSDDLSFTYDTSGEYPKITLDNPSSFKDYSLYKANHYIQRLSVNSQDALQAKVDYAYKMQAFEQIGFKTGLSYKEDERHEDNLFYHQYKGGTVSPESFIGDYEALSKPDLLGGQEVSYLDYDKFKDYWENSKNNGWADSRNQIDEGLMSEYQLKEEVTAAYLMTRYELEGVILSAGIRYEHTSLTSTGHRLLVDPNSDEKYPEVTETNSYSNWLPSANVIWYINEDLKLNTAYSRSLGRAEYKDLSVLGTNEIDHERQKITITSKNPALDPRISDNIDISLEYMFDEIDGAFSIGYFYKDIDNEIYNRVLEEQVIVNGTEYELTDKRPANANSAKLQGLELGLFLNSFDFIDESLTNVGMSINYTHMDGELGIEMNDNTVRKLASLIYQPENIASMTMFWTPQNFEFKLAYRYTDVKLHTTSASSPTYDEFIGETKQLDFNARYNIGNGFKIFLDARNILDDGTTRDLSYGETNWSRDYGRSYWLGVTYKF